MNGSSETAAIISTEGWSKTFSDRTVLRSVSLDVFPGEVHGLLGQNGSGKSTFIKILAGYHDPDPGARLAVRGDPVTLPLPPGRARELGLSFVHQDLGLIDSATVLENLRAGRYETRAGWFIPWARERASARRVLGSFGLDVDPDAKVADLREVDRAILAIVRALEQLQHTKGGLLVLDEPTAFLPRDGIEQLFQAVKDVAATGVGVLFVTHHLDEVWAITNRVSVLRDGMLVAVEATADTSEQVLIAHILGFSLDELYPTPHRPKGEVILSVEDLSGALVDALSFEVHRGEIIGLTGLRGMGYEEVPYLLFGVSRARSGKVRLGKSTISAVQLTPQTALHMGLGLLPANRQRWGTVGPASVRENVTIPTLSKYFVRGLLRHRLEMADVERLLTTFDVRPPEQERPMSTLSGGNQQKALLGKWFATKPQLLLMHEPTQGVDVGATRQIFQQIRDAAQSGTSLLLASTEYGDLAHLCDRVLVFRGGRVVAELHGESLTEERIVEQCFKQIREQRIDTTRSSRQDSAMRDGQRADPHDR